MTNYFLHVDIIVHEAGAPAFETRVGEFLGLGGFGRLGHELRSSFEYGMRTADPFDYTGYESYEGPAAQVEKQDGRISSKAHPANSIRAFRYVHVWRIPSSDLVPAMSAAVDDQLYTQVDDLVVREIQNLVVPVPRFRIPNEPQGDKFLRVTRKLASSDIPAYIFKSGAVVSDLEGENWFLRHQFQNVTGPLNTITEFWQVPNNVTHERAVHDRVLSGVLGATIERLLGGFNRLPKAEVRESFLRVVYNGMNGEQFG